jgi:hypothetical protein
VPNLIDYPAIQWVTGLFAEDKGVGAMNTRSKLGPMLSTGRAIFSLYTPSVPAVACYGMTFTLKLYPNIHLERQRNNTKNFNENNRNSDRILNSGFPECESVCYELNIDVLCVAQILCYSGVRPSVKLLMSHVSSSGKDCSGSIHGLFEGL